MVQICLKEYLARLEREEGAKEEGRTVPSMDGLAELVGIHRVTMNKIVNNRTKSLNFGIATRIIEAMSLLGFDMQITDLIIFHKITTTDKELAQ